MRKFVLDTNLYVSAFRNVAGAAELTTFLATFAPSTYLSSIVLHELLVGANTPAKARDVQERVALPLVRTSRVITPSHHAWQVSGAAIARMAGKEKRNLRTVPKSLVHDYLLAASCRESGATLITDNMGDFVGIRRYLTFEFEAPWPR